MDIFKKIMRVIVRGAILTYCILIHRLKVVGKENIPKEGAVIFCGNHVNYLDAPILVVTAGRHMRFVAKEELRKNPFFAFLGYVFEAIYVKRDAKDIGAMKDCLKTLKDGKSVGLFPEGTRKGIEQNEGKIKGGATYLAIKTGVKIVPVGIKCSTIPFKKAIITYGEPIDYSDRMLEKGDKDAVDKATEELKEEIWKLTKNLG